MQGNDKTIKSVEEAAKYPLLNYKVLNNIFELGDALFAENLIFQYLKKAEQISIQIQHDIKKKKTSKIYALANELRDSSLYIGTERISQLAGFIYDQAKKRNITPLKEAVILLLQTLNESDKALRTAVDKNRASKVNKE